MSSIPSKPRPIPPDPDHNAEVALQGIELAPGVRVSEGADIISFSYSRSGGPGGQNVNKLSTKAELRVKAGMLPLPMRAIERLRRLAGRRLTDGDEILIVSESQRSQSRNRTECLEKFRELLIEAMTEPKIRRKTKPSRGSKERRLTEKKSRGEIKRNRRGDGHD